MLIYSFSRHTVVLHAALKSKVYSSRLVAKSVSLLFSAEQEAGSGLTKVFSPKTAICCKNGDKSDEIKSKEWSVWPLNQNA